MSSSYHLKKNPKKVSGFTGKEANTNKQKAIQKKTRKVTRKNSNPDVKARIRAIETIYQEYSKKLDVLAGEQDRIITDFLNTIKNRRLKELREKIGNS